MDPDFKLNVFAFISSLFASLDPRAKKYEESCQLIKDALLVHIKDLIKIDHIEGSKKNSLVSKHCRSSYDSDPIPKRP